MLLVLGVGVRKGRWFSARTHKYKPEKTSVTPHRANYTICPLDAAVLWSRGRARSDSGGG